MSARSDRIVGTVSILVVIIIISSFCGYQLGSDGQFAAGYKACKQHHDEWVATVKGPTLTNIQMGLRSDGRFFKDDWRYRGVVEHVSASDTEVRLTAIVIFCLPTDDQRNDDVLSKPSGWGAHFIIEPELYYAKHKFKPGDRVKWRKIKGEERRGGTFDMELGW